MSHRRFRAVIGLAGLAAAATLVVGCSFLLNLGVTNSCGQAIAVGIEGTVESPLDGWYPVTDGSELIVSVDGFDKVLITVVAEGAEQVFDHTEVDLGSLETATTDGVDLAKLDLTEAGLCP